MLYAYAHPQLISASVARAMFLRANDPCNIAFCRVAQTYLEIA